MENKCIDVNNLSLEDIREEYLQLFDRYKILQTNSENDAQRIYELKRNLDTALAAEEYLTQELEQATNNTNENLLTQKQHELEELRRKNTALEQKNTELQQQTEQITSDNEVLRQKLENSEILTSHKKYEEDEFAANAAKVNAERLSVLENENMELLKKLNEAHEQSVRFVVAINDKEGALEILKDRVQCLEENLQSKRDDLEEKTQLLESTQEQLGEANARIAMLTTVPDNAERKGNSLFAEVDDQRQAMRQLLAAQKQNYMEMKKVYQESQYEIRRLKNENAAMHNELDACIAIFCISNKVFHDKLLERLNHVNNEKDVLEKRIVMMHNCLREMTNIHGVGWLDSMLNFCKDESDELKKQLHSSRFKLASLEEQIRNVSQELVRWRFETLRLRCLLLDREILLKNNNISYKPSNMVEMNISAKEVEEARPRIATVNKNLLSLLEKNMKVENIEVNKVKEEIDIKIENIIEKQQNNSIENNSVESNAVEECLKTDVKEEVDVEKEENIKVENKVPENKVHTVFTVPTTQNLPSSIMSKPKDIFHESRKSVTFSNNAPIIHALTPKIDKENLTNTKTKTVLQKRTKSGLLVRHVVFGSNAQNENPAKH